MLSVVFTIAFADQLDIPPEHHFFGQRVNSGSPRTVD
jgi:hypothetical protein